MFAIKSLIVLLACCGLVADAQNKQLLKPIGRTQYTFNQRNVFYETAFGNLHMIQNLFFDTGASQSWVVSTKCQESRCYSHSRYDLNASTTGYLLGPTQEIDYSSLGIVRGDLCRDRLILTKMIVKSQTFVEAINLPDEEILPRGVDGIIGIDFETFHQNATYKNPIQSMVEQGILAEPVFTLYVGQSDEYQQNVVFGTVFPHKVQEPIIYFPVTHSERWQFHLEEIIARGSDGHDVIGVCQGGCEAVLSSRSPFILGPSDEVKRFNEQIGATRTEDGRFLLSSCSISQLPNLILRTIAKEFVVTPDEYVVQVSENPDRCFSGIFEGSQFTWVLGRNFLSSYYTVFDYSNKRVGFSHI